MPHVYTDASSAILLFRSGLFEQTAQVFSLILAGEVFRELTRDDYPGSDCFCQMAASGKIRILNEDPDICGRWRMKGFSTMDKGEQETIAHYLDSYAPAFILMDDGKGARFCYRHHIPFINALLVPKLFWYSGLMDETRAKEKMKVLTGVGRYSSRIISKARELSPEDLAPFIPVKR